MPPALDAVAHVALAAGRILLANGEDTASVEEAARRLAAGYGCEARLLVGYEGLLLTVERDGASWTKLGRRIPALNIGMAAVVAVRRLLDEAASGRVAPSVLAERLAAAERLPPPYPRLLVVLGLALTAASLARLFGGDWGAVGIAAAAGAAGTAVRQTLGARGVAPVIVVFAAALAGGLVGALGARAGLTGTPPLCLVAPGMILMPGVPLINGAQDLIRNRVSVGLARLGFGAMVTVAIGLGLAAATLVTGIGIPLDLVTHSVPFAQDVLFSALAAIGYALLFGVPSRLAWLCPLCGALGFSSRALLELLGFPLVGGTLVGALLAGSLAEALSRRLAVPAASFAFPGVVALVPGFFAFRATGGAIAILSAGASASPALLGETAALAIACVAMVGAIAVGVVAPVLATAGRARNARPA